MGTVQEASGNITTFSFSNNAAEINADNVTKTVEFDDCGRETLIELTTISVSDENPTPHPVTLFAYELTYGFVLQENGSYINELINVTDLTVGEGGTGNDPEPEPDPEIIETTEAEDEDDYEITENKDQFCNVLTSTVTAGNLSQTTTYTYSNDGNYLISETDSDGCTVQYDYNSATGILQALTDANGNETEYTYNAARELANVHLDVSGLVNGNDMEASYTYDKGRLSSLTYGDFAYEFTYDIWGNLLCVEMNDTPLVSYSYGPNAWERQANVMTYGNGNTVYYTYDNLGMVESVAYGSASNVRFTYDYSDEQLKAVNDLLTGQRTSYSENGYTIYAYDNSVLYSIAYNEDDNGGYTETINGVTYTSTPSQDGGTEKTVSTAGGLSISYSSAYDALNRMTIKSLQGYLQNTTLPDVVQTYTYTGTRFNAGNRVSEYEVAWASGNNQHTSLTMGYDYDYNGNITEITQTEHTYSEHIGLDPIYPPISPNGLGGSPGNLPQTSYTVNYTYDEANQLTSATDSQTGLTYRYTYDASGNLRTMNTYLSSTATTPIHAKMLNYTDGILTGYSEDGVTTTFTTDDMGSPILMTRGGNTVAELTWGESRSLTGYETADFSAEYTYNADGLRIQKDVSVGNTTKTTKFIWGNNGLVGTIADNRKVTILYDSGGEAAGFVLNDTNLTSLSGIYTYIKNLQGDVLRVVDESGSTVLSYAYDPWGVPTVTGNQTLAELNPCSYRSYYYDWETGYYYLQSRYYDPKIGRFINIDNVALLATAEALVEFNLFAYCINNPIAKSDPTGYTPANVIGAIIGAIIGAVGGYLLSRLLADKIGLSGWKRTLFIAGLTAIITAAAAVIGYFLGPYIANFAQSKIAAIKQALISSACFVAGTMVLTENGYKPIEEICIGDKVFSVDPISGEYGYKAVKCLYVHETSCLVSVIVGKNEIVTTPTHPFWVVNNGWVQASSLSSGDVVLSTDGVELTIDSVSDIEVSEPVVVYNFEVEDFHTYFVSNTPVLVHNMCAMSFKYKSPKEIARLLHISQEYFHRHLKPAILRKISSTVLRRLGTNPDIYLSANGMIQLVSRITKGVSYDTGLNIWDFIS